MSEEVNAFGGLEARDRDPGEVFMLTFAAVGSLALLESDAAEARPTTLPPLTIEEAQQLMRGGAPAPSAKHALEPQAAADHAFLAAFAALTPPPRDSLTSIYTPAPTTGSADFPLAAYDASPRASLDDDAIGSSSPLAGLAGPSDLSIHGDDLVIALAAGAKLTISGDNDLVLTSTNNTIDVLSGSSVAIQGGGANVTLGERDAVSLSGTGYEVHASGPSDVVTLQAASQAAVYGDGVLAHVAAPDANLTLVGAGNTVNVAAAGSTVTVGGASDVHLNAPGAVNLMDASTLAAYGAGAAYLGANDFVSLFASFDVFTSAAAGVTTISSFGVDDTLHLQTTHADIASLLGAATEADGATTLHLAPAGASVTLLGVDKSQLTVFAGGGHIQLS